MQDELIRVWALEPGPCQALRERYFQGYGLGREQGGAQGVSCAVGLEGLGGDGRDKKSWPKPAFFYGGTLLP